MLRTSMGTEGLFDVFARLGKTITFDNAHTLCALACTSPEIFFAPALPPLHCHMATDITAVWCRLRGVQWYTAYGNLARKVIGQYDLSTYTDAEQLKAIFDALDAKVAEIKHVLEKDGFPPLE